MSALYDVLLAVMQSCVFVRELPTTGLNDWQVCMLNDSLPHVLHIYRCFSQSQKHFSFPLIHKLFVVSVSRLLPSHLSQTQVPLDLMYSVYILCDILAHSLSRRREEGMQIFVEGDWIPLAAPTWIGHSGYTHSPIMEAYVCGSSMLSKPAVRQLLLDYLYQPRNVILAFFTVMRDSQRLRQLVELDPTHPSWTECLSVMQAVLRWSRRPPNDVTQFPLEAYLDGMVLRYPVDRDFVEDSFSQLLLRKLNEDGYVQELEHALGVLEGIVGKEVVNI
ncbi:hypothetical protein BDZ89DRAFT_1073074 [Hymenopellis radicata]|nr:hypothetical protein BDZ89DRAFT_1073074 [Hymenopellis radicata]